MKLYNVIIDGDDNFITASNEEEVRRYFKLFNIESIKQVTFQVAPSIQKVLEYYEENVDYI